MCAALAFAAIAPAQDALPPQEKDAPAAAQDQPSPDQLPPLEDKSKTEDEHFAFNPVQSKKDVTVGEFYFKKSDFKAAAGRFRDATRRNDGNAEAWLRLGDAEEKMNDLKAAREAWEKYLQIAPQAKNAAEVRKKVEKLK